MHILNRDLLQGKNLKSCINNYIPNKLLLIQLYLAVCMQSGLCYSFREGFFQYDNDYVNIVKLLARNGMACMWPQVDGIVPNLLL